MSIIHQKVVDDQGQPEAALVPWDVFVQIQHLLEDDEPLSDIEREALAQADQDRATGNTDAFVSLDDLKSELSD
ncbi:MAG: hypothetical protein AAGH72_07480 [Verrucomicrobiota bacterium]